MKKYRGAAHNEIQTGIKMFLRKAGCTMYEDCLTIASHIPRHYIINSAPQRKTHGFNKEADIIFEYPPSVLSPLNVTRRFFIDITLVTPWGRGYTPYAGPPGAAETASINKHKLYNDIYQFPQAKFNTERISSDSIIILAFEVTGAFTAETNEFFSLLSTALSARHSHYTASQWKFYIVSHISQLISQDFAQRHIELRQKISSAQNLAPCITPLHPPNELVETVQEIRISTPFPLTSTIPRLTPADTATADALMEECLKDTDIRLFYTDGS
jgi:hypothetical protein